MKKMLLTIPMTIFVFGILISTNLIACDKKCKRAISSYEKYIKKAEQKNCNPNRGKNAKTFKRACGKDLKALEKRYSKMSDDLKNNSEIASLRDRQTKMQSLLENADKAAAIDKFTNPYQRTLKSAVKSDCRIDRPYNNTLCAPHLIRAEEYYEKIPKDKRNLPAVVALRKEHDKVIKIYDEMNAIMKAKDDSRAAASQLDAEIRKDYEYLPISSLEKGKNNQSIILPHLKSLDERMGNAAEFAKKCDGKYKELVAKKYRVRHGYTADVLCDLTKNAKKYRNQAAVAAYKAILDDKIKRDGKNIETLRNSGYISANLLNRYLYRYDKVYNEVANKVTKGYKEAGMTAPSFAELKALEGKMKSALKSAIAKNEWNGKNQDSNVSSAIRKRAKQKAEKMGLKLLKIGYTENWRIEKNALGIPLGKFTNGYIVMKEKDESFCRQRYTRYYRSYNGSGYEAVSAVNMVPVVSPIKCP